MEKAATQRSIAESSSPQSLAVQSLTQRVAEDLQLDERLDTDGDQKMQENVPNEEQKISEAFNSVNGDELMHKGEDLPLQVCKKDDCIIQQNGALTGKANDNTTAHFNDKALMT